MTPIISKASKTTSVLVFAIASLFVAGCSFNVSQLLPVGLTASSDGLAQPTLAATAPPPTQWPDTPAAVESASTGPTPGSEAPAQVEAATNIEAPTRLSSAEPPTPTAAQATPIPTNTPLPSPTPIPAGPFYYVSLDGNDWSGTGSSDQPWATIGRALQLVEDGATVLVRPGTYFGQLSPERKFNQGVVIQSEFDYQAQLRHDDTVVACYTCQGITLAGFDIAHTGEGAGRYVIQIQDLTRDQSGGRRVTLRNNVIHDSRNNDLLKVNNGADAITITGNIFYNMGGPGLDSLIDVNSATNVTIEDNIFFNDFQASERSRDNDTGSFVVIKDSNGNEDSNLGSKNVIVRRNIFLNWQGDPNNAFLVIGEDNVDYFQAENVLVENNLLLGNSSNPMRAALHIRGCRDVIFRSNTITGDLPSRSYAFRLSRAEHNPINESIHFYNNIWSDPESTMGVFKKSNGDLFAEASPADAQGVVLFNNLYWNGGELIPWDRKQLVNYTDDPQRLLSDPRLSDPQDISTPIWLSEENRFADGSSTIREVFETLVLAYGQPAPGSRVLDAADPERAPAEDILGRQRVDGAPDVGAYEMDSP